MRVRATQDIVIGGVQRAAGDEFDLDLKLTKVRREGRHLEVVAEKTVAAKPKVEAPKEESPKADKKKSKSKKGKD